MLTNFFIAILFIFFLIYAYLKRNASFFKRHGIPSIKGNLIFGNISELLLGTRDALDVVRGWYNHPATRNKPFVGIHVFNRQGILVKDLELMKQIMIKDFNKFSNRSSRADVHNDILSAANLFFVKNPEWRMIRQKLTPVFTSGKLKQMFHLVDNVGIKLAAHLDELAKKDKALEVKSLCGCYTTDVIASFAFGLEANSFKDPNNDFRMAGLNVMDVTFKRVVDFISIFFIPKLVPLFKARIIPEFAENVFRRIFTFAIEERRRSGLFRNDLIDILLAFKEASNKGDTELEFTDEMLLAQAAIFFLAGYETSSSAMSFALYEISKNPEIQKKLRKEVKEIYEKEGESLTYEAVNSMEYMSMVLSETLRLYPAIAFLDREVTLELDDSGYSLEPFSDFIMPQGMPVYIPTAGYHYDPQYFPDPYKFDPERFSAENKGNIVPGSYQPFGLGPHNCIGERMGLLQAKVGLFHLLKNHYYQPNSKTMKTMKLKKGIGIQAEGGIHLDAIRD